MACLIGRCWSEEPEDRPSIKAVLRTLNKINPLVSEYLDISILRQIWHALLGAVGVRSQKIGLLLKLFLERSIKLIHISK